MKRKEIYTQDASTIYSTITRLSRDLYLRKTGLSKHTLAKSLKSIGLNITNDVEKLFSPIRFSQINVFGVVFIRKLRIRRRDEILPLLRLVLDPPLPVEITHFIFTLNLTAQFRDRPNTPGCVLNRANQFEVRTRPCRAIFNLGLSTTFFVWNLQNLIRQP